MYATLRSMPNPFLKHRFFSFWIIVVLTFLYKKSILQDYNITLLSFPLHCSHVTQPLDKYLDGPLKTFIKQACDTWMLEKDKIGKFKTLHVIPKIVSYAIPKAITPENIKAGFKATGIYLYDRKVFPPEKFLSC